MSERPGSGERGERVKKKKKDYFFLRLYLYGSWMGEKERESENKNYWVFS